MGAVCGINSGHGRDGLTAERVSRNCTLSTHSSPPAGPSAILSIATTGIECTRVKAAGIETSRKAWFSCDDARLNDKSALRVAGHLETILIGNLPHNRVK
jgi:hypothetical protein